MSTPLDFANLAAWYRYDRGITSASGLVSQWDDASGNARHLVQATGTNQPRRMGDGSILFDGVDNYKQTAAFTLNQPWSFYILFSQPSFLNANYILDGDIATSGSLQQINPSPNVALFSTGGAAYVTASGPVAGGGYGVISGVWNGTSSSIQLNNGTVVTGDPGAGNPGRITLGCAGNISAFSNIQVKEVAIYSVAHDAATRDALYNYLDSVNKPSFSKQRIFASHGFRTS